MTREEKRTLRIGLLFISPWILGFAMFVAYPFITSIIYSFCYYSLFQPLRWIGLVNYTTIVKDRVFWLSLYNTFYYVALFIPLSFFVAFGLALLLNSKVRGQSIYRVIFYIPSLVPMVALSILWMWMFNGEYGIVNNFLSTIGIERPPNWLSDPSYAKFAIVVMGLWTLGQSVVVYLAALQDIPRSLMEAADIDGANWFHKIRHIVIPIISPAILFNVLMSVIGSFQIFAIPWIMTGGGPARSTTFYVMYLFQKSFSDFKMGYAAAMAWILFVIILLLTLIILRLSKKQGPLHGMNMNRINKSIITIVLIFFSCIFLFPFLWMVVTSLKPIDQTMKMPPVWLPKAYYINANGMNVRVVFDANNCRINEDSYIVDYVNPLPNDYQFIVGKAEFEKKAGRDVFGNLMYDRKAVQITREVPAGWFRVRELVQSDDISKKTRVFYVTRDQVREKVKFEFGNYIKVMQKIPFFMYLRNTLIVAVLSLIGVLVSNTLVAYGFSKILWKGRETAFAITISTMMVPFPVTMIPLFVVFKKLGMTGTLMPLWIPAFFGGAFNIFLLRQFFRSIPNDLIEAAKIDGCSEFGIFWRIILPLSRPILTVVALFHFMYVWNDFMGPLLYLTDQKTFTLSLGIQFFQSQHGGTEWHYLMAASTMMIAPIVVLFFFAQKTFIESITLTGTKG